MWRYDRRDLRKWCHNEGKTVWDPPAIACDMIDHFAKFLNKVDVPGKKMNKEVHDSMVKAVGDLRVKRCKAKTPYYSAVTGITHTYSSAAIGPEPPG